MKVWRGEPDYAVAPGALLRKHLAQNGIASRDFARRIGVDDRFFERLSRGEVPVDERLAATLERETGVPAYFWRNAERTFRKRLPRTLET